MVLMIEHCLQAQMLAHCDLVISLQQQLLMFASHAVRNRVCQLLQHVGLWSTCAV